MTRKRAVLWGAVVSIVLAAIVIVCSILFLRSESGHVEFFGGQSGLNLRLVRTELHANALGADGYMHEISDDTPVDFSKSSKQNIFGLDEQSIIVPSSRYTANLTVSADRAFAYWLKIDFTGAEVFAKQLKVTVKAGEREENFYLSDAREVGSEDTPLGLVAAGEISPFTVQIDFKDEQHTNDDAQKQALYFDLKICVAETE